MLLMIGDKFYNEQEIRQLLRQQSELINKLKIMLLQACSDFCVFVDDHAETMQCAHYFRYQSCKGCPLNESGDNCRWIFEDEALDLIAQGLQLTVKEKNT